MAKMTAKQERFVEEYLVDLNATHAARRAGYAEPDARQTGYRLLQKPHVIEAIAKARAEMSERTQVTVDRIVQEFAAIGFADPRDFFDESGNLRPIHELDDRTAAALASIEVVTKNVGDGEVEHVHKIKLWDKPASLDKLVKILGGYAPDKHEHTGKDGEPLQINIIRFGEPDKPAE